MVEGFDYSFVETHSHYIILTDLKFVVNLLAFAFKCQDYDMCVCHLQYWF